MFSSWLLIYKQAIMYYIHQKYGLQGVCFTYFKGFLIFAPLLSGWRSAVSKGSGKDASLPADPGVASSIPTRSHTFVEIDHEIISTVILLPYA